MVANGCQRLPTVANSCQRLPMVANGCQWLPMVSDGYGCQRLPFKASARRMAQASSMGQLKRHFMMKIPFPPVPSESYLA